MTPVGINLQRLVVGHTGMTDIDIKLPRTPNADAVIAAVEKVAASETLHVTMKDTLKKYPGCIHWHFKLGKEPGILEVTWWPSEAEERPDRLWLSVHNNRQGAWMAAFLPRMKGLLEAALTS